MIDVANNHKNFNPKNTHKMVIRFMQLKVFADFKSKIVQIVKRMHKRFIFLNFNFLSLE